MSSPTASLTNRVFLSWSGADSEQVAKALRAWLPLLFQQLRPWASCADLAAGSRCQLTLARRLCRCNFGILCLTPSNIDRAWILYEAGALSKVFDNSRVCPFLLDVAIAELPAPLQQFQCVSATEPGTRNLALAINASLGRTRLPSEVLSTTFEKLWPTLEQQLAHIRETAEPRQGVPIVIRGSIERTNTIVSDLQELEKALARGERTEVRYSGFLSAFAIGSNEVEQAEGDAALELQQLAEERECLVRLATRGCRLRCVITPPSEYDLVLPLFKKALQRLAILIEFLQSSSKAHEHIEWAVSPWRQKNTYIIGTSSYIEGFKTGPGPGPAHQNLDVRLGFRVTSGKSSR